MTPRQIDLVQASWIRVHAVRDDAAALFYSDLFHRNPAYRALFTGDLVQQGRKLMAMLNAVILNLKDLQPVSERARELGRQHAAWGLRQADYDLAEDVLLHTLATVLRDGFTPEDRDAWSCAWRRVTALMLPRNAA